MRIKLIEELPMATSAELYQLSWVIEQLLADPRRIVQVRAQLHTGQQIRYLVSVWRWHLENGDASADDGVHERTRWTPWKTGVGARGAFTRRS
jgi:hypothetical protein